VTHLICASLAKIKAAKSQICIIDRANINTRGGPVSSPRHKARSVSSREAVKFCQECEPKRHNEAASSSR
jgi:hypothetical protein